MEALDDPELKVEHVVQKKDDHWGLFSSCSIGNQIILLSNGLLHRLTHVGIFQPTVLDGITVTGLPCFQLYVYNHIRSHTQFSNSQE